MDCPVCRAGNNAGPQCRRCRADLALLLDLEEQRSRVLSAARRELAEGRAVTATELAARASELRRDEASLRLLAVCHLLRRDYGEAWRAYQSLARRASEG
jgi:hypothetical protein